jgi:segregation and condensation protein A
VSTNVQLEIFEGPLDLLLHLIKKNEVSITDIPIATITEQYLATIELMQTLNLDVAGEFLVMAATLIHIKSRMLLPAGETSGDEDEDDGADPREELVRRLLEYQRYKDAAEQLEQREVLTRDVFARAAAPTETPAPAGFREISVLELLAAIRRVLERLPKDVVHEVTLDKVTVRQKMTLLLDTLRSRQRLYFEELFTDVKTRLEVVVTFLAMLELVKVRAIRILQDELSGPILIEAAVDMDQAAASVTTEDIEEEQHGA